MKLNPRYIFMAMLLFFTEVLIALYVKDSFIRPYGGDVLAVILLYCILAGLFSWRRWVIALSVMVFSFGLETLQYYNFVERIGLGDSQLANVVLGNSFSWKDLIAYTVGTVIILFFEYRKSFPPFSRRKSV